MASIPKMSAQHIATLKSRRAELDERLRQALETANLLRGEIVGIDHALAVMQGDETPISLPVANIAHQTSDRRPRGAVKDIVLGLLMEFSADGLRSTDIVDQAKARGVELDRNSVASLLSRLTIKEGVLVYDNATRKYRPAPPNVTPLRSVV